MMDPQQLGPYRIIRRLGRGGMGTVYEAVHVVTNEPAAVKMLSESLIGEADFRARFELEIETLRKLNHPNIVRLLGFGEEEEILFYVMELVRGTSLDQELRAGRTFSWPEVANIGIQICRALRHAHDRGIIHRDLKPANLLRAEDGTIKLSDFGIARLFGAPSHTGVGSVLGTIEYMAPEQAEAMPLGPRADLYSLGAVLYALLVGRPPFKVASFVQLLQLHRTSQPEPIRNLVPDCPEELERIIFELLAKDPDKRISNAMLASRRIQAMLHALAKLEPDQAERAMTILEHTGELIDFGVHDEPPDPRAVAPETPTAAWQLAESQPGEKSPAGEAVADRPPQVSPTGQAGLGTPSMWQPTLETDGLRDLAIAGQQPSQAEQANEVRPATELVKPPQPELAEPSRNPPATPVTGTNSRFVEVPPEELDKLEPPPSERQPIFGIQTIVLVVALVALGGTIWYFLQPPSADQLYARITAKVTDPSDSEALLAAAPEIEDFLTRCSDDPRAVIIREYQQEIDLLRLERRFELQSRQKPANYSSIPIERDYLEALRYAQLDPEVGIKKLEALLQFYEYADLPESSSKSATSAKGAATSGSGSATNSGHKVVGHTAECLELARRRLDRLKRQLAPAIQNQKDLLEWRLEEAERIATTDPDKADAIRRAIITLYQEKAWAAPYVERARAALSQSSRSDTAVDQASQNRGASQGESPKSTEQEAASK